jgi:diguanylate cyclase (GGDEF)-like protein
MLHEFFPVPYKTMKGYIPLGYKYIKGLVLTLSSIFDIIKLAERFWRQNMFISPYRDAVTQLRTFVFCAKVFLVFLLISIRLVSTQVNAQDLQVIDEEKHILFLSSYHPSFPTLDNQVRGLKESFIHENILLDIEYMDAKRFETQENMDYFRTYLKYKLDRLPTYDLVIVGDDAALQFAMDNKAFLFEQLPIVFLGINSIERADKAYAMGEITGVTEITSVRDTLDLINELQPQLQKLYVIVDNTLTGQAERQTVDSQEDNYLHIEFIYWSMHELSYEELSQQLALVSKSDAILLLSAYVDRDMNTRNFNQILALINSKASAPVYHLYDFGVGNGLIGGKVIDFYEQGKSAGNIALKILGGIHIRDLKPIKNTTLNSVMVDYMKLKEFDLDPKSLPSETHFVNRPVSYIQENAELIMISLLIIVSLVVLLFLAILNINRRKKVEIQLQETNTELTAYYEELLSVNEELEASEEELRVNYIEIEKTNKCLEESEERYKYVFELSNSGLWERNMVTNEVFISRDWYHNLLAKGTNKQVDKMSNESVLELFYKQLDAYKSRELQELKKALFQGRIFSYHIVLHCCHQTDQPVFIEEKAQSIYNHEGELIRVVGSHNDITSATLYERQLEEFAYKDQLTKIPNRIDLERYMENLLYQSKEEIAAGSILLLDLDNFKFVNNTYGHEIGDELLKAISLRLTSQLSARYKIGRISGDEFAIVCPNSHSIEDIKQVAHHVLGIFENKFHLRDHSIFVTVSIGIALFPENGSDFDTLINRCNSSLFDAKNNGKNRFEFYDTAMNDSMETKIYIQNNLREAILSNRFCLYYQPIYSIEKNAIVGFEALIRWKDQVRGFIPPSEFIVVAEKMGVINKIGEWVIKEAANFIKQLTKACNKGLYVSINVSAVQLMQQNFVNHFFQVIDDIEVPYSSICIEITETALMQSFDKNAEKLMLLQEKGIKISLDDFGTGYSSLNYLRKLPVNILKIDKSFIDEIANNSSSRDLSEGIILLAQKMGIYVIAEGVETKEQLNYMKDFSCDGVQGYLIARPIPEKAVKEYYEGFLGIDY